MNKIKSMKDFQKILNNELRENGLNRLEIQEISELEDYIKNDKEREIFEIRKNYKSNYETAKHSNISRHRFDRLTKKLLFRKFNIDGEEKFKEDFKKLIKKPIDLNEVSEEIVAPKYLVKGVSTLYDNEGNIKIQWVKTEADKTELLGMMEQAVKEIIKDLEKNLEKINKTQNEEIRVEPMQINHDICVIYPLGDIHLGMFSWREETGTDYDLDIAKELLEKAFDQMIKSAPNSETAILANLGDFFHIDDTRNETLKSKHRLDVDTRYPKILKTGLQLLVNIIEKLLTKHKKIIIRNAIGNHDPHTTFFLNEFIRAWFRNNERIEIIDDIKTFWFYKFGKNLIGVTHGDCCKINELPEIMAHDAAEHWSDTEFRYWYIGHFHHQQVKEFRTCVVESFGILAGRDHWTHSSGYRAKRQIKYKVLHKEYGEIQEGTFNIKLILDS